jgi:hypothetical protein
LYCTEEVGLLTGSAFRRSTRIAALLGFLALAVAKGALAQVTPAAGYTPPDDTQSVKVASVIYFNYTYTKSPLSTDAAGNLFSPNSFDVARAYINVTGNISHRLVFRVTPDVSRETNATPSLSGSLVFRLKYGFMQYNLDDWTGNWKQTWVRGGIQQTPVIDYQEGIYRYRFQGTVFAEREGALTSSDAGASFHSNLPSNYGDFHVGVYNGEGYSKAETNSQKALQMRGTIRPFATSAMTAARGLRLTGFYDEDHIVVGGPRTRGMFNVTYEHKHLNAGFDYLNQHDTALPASSPNCSVATPPAACGVTVAARGWSFWATPAFKEKGNGPELLLRIDRYEPNRAVSPQVIRTRSIAGIAYWFPHPGGNSTAAILLDFEQVKQLGTLTQQRYALHGLINF